MNFVYKQYLLLVIIVFLLFSFFSFKEEGRFFRWVRDHWFFKRSKFSIVSSFFKTIGLGLLLLSLLDLRGKEESREDDVKEQKTVLLIDNSLSMLADDVRPNRLSKASFIARHFVKNSIGHKISVVLFSDNSKRIVPFTNDQDLLDARISGISDKIALGGGSSIVKAIKETEQYLRTNGSDGGNVLVLTDAESSDELDLKISDSINLAVVGIGTEKGSNIPLRDRRGVSRGFKERNGKKVITKLDRESLEKISSLSKYSKTWVASTYSLPTNEILSFFDASDQQKSVKGRVSTKPVLTQYLLVPGVVLLMLGFIFSSFNPYILAGMFFLISTDANAQNFDPASKMAKKKEMEKFEKKEKKYLKKWKEKGLSQEEKMDLASLYLRLDKNDQARKIYKENLKEIKEGNKEDFFNWSSLDLKENKLKNAIGKLKELDKYLEDKSGEEYEDLKNKVRENTMLALKKKKKKKQKKDNKKNDKDQKEGKEGDKKNSKDQKGKDQKNEKEGKEDKMKKSKDKDGEGKKKESKMKNLPTVLKQLVDEDNNMQKKFMNTKTKDKGFKQRRDW